MKRRRIRIWALPSMQRTKALIVTSVCCGTGIVLGCLFALWTAATGTDALGRYMDSFLSLTSASTTVPHLLQQAWSVLRLPLLVFMLRFTLLGVLFLPMIIGIKGFLLSFATSTFVKCYGLRGEAAALVLFGGSSVVEMVILLFLAMDSWLIARERGLGSERDRKRNRNWKGYILCIVILCVDVGLQCATEEWMGTILRWLLMIG